MIVLFYSDIHIRENSSYIGYNAISPRGMTLELENYIRGIEFVSDSIKKYNPDIVFNLGDTVNIVDRLSIRELTALSQISVIQDTCKNLSIPHIILQGNHDIYSLPKDSKDNQDTNLSHISIGCILSKFCDKYVTDIEEYEYQGVNFSLIPYLQKTPEVLSAFLDSKHSMILTHNEFQGSVYESGIQSNTSLVATKKIPIFSGHIHKPQITGNITYIGSLISNKFDRNIGFHGIGIYDTDKKKYSQIENTYSRHYIKCKNIDEMLALDPDRYLVKLQTRESKEEVENRLGESHRYQYVYVREIDRKDSVEIRYSVGRSQEPKVMLRNYLEENNPDVLDIYDEVIDSQEE